MKKMIFPKPVYFIVGDEFCERFCYYGMRTVLFLYLMEILRYPKETATMIYHTFTMLAYFFPLIGAIVSDSWLGKYRTILYLSIVYVFGQILLSASSTPWLHLPIREMSLLGLFLIALGTGGIKPCIASFGAEQFKLPEQEAQLTSFFSAFFIAINSGALISTFITPILRKDVTCFGQNTCYPLAFLLPSILMILALVIFVGGRRMYKIKEPEGNILLKVAACICHAIKRKMSSSEKKKHWLDYAGDKYESDIIKDTKQVLKLLRLYIPLSIFFTLYEQTGSRWVYQATRMDGEVLGYLIKPDHFIAFNMLLFIILLVLIDWFVYPLIERFLFINTPLRKLTLSGILAATSFIISGLLELKLETTYVLQPSAGLAQIRIFNTINCPIDLSLNGQNYKLEALDLYQNLSIPVTGNVSLDYDLNVTCPSAVPLKLTGSINAEENKALSYLLGNDGFQMGFSDKIDKSSSGDPLVRALILTEAGNPASASLRLDSSESYEFELHGDSFFSNFIEVNHNFYNVTVDGVQVASGVSLRSGGVYNIVGRVSADGSVHVNTATIVQPNSIHMVWLLPQFVVITIGEVMFFVVGLGFSYTESPTSLKSMGQALFLLNSAIGNLVVVVITKLHFIQRQVYEFFMYAGLMYASMLIFTIMAIFYKYVDTSSSNDTTKDDIDLKKIQTKQGIENETYSDRL